MSGPYQSPSHPPPPPRHPAVTRRRSPPQVIRAEDAREDNEDEDGEAPPAYADAVAAGPEVGLPPQRRDDQGRLLPSQTSSHEGARPMATLPQATGSFSPSPRPNNLPGSFPPPSQRPPPNNNMGPYQSPPLGMGYPHHASPSHFRPPPAQVIPYGHRPPPGALVLRPGDPRIGGRLCYKCGGPGILDSMWWGSETCHVCGGSGRIL